MHPVWGPIAALARGWAADPEVRHHGAAGGVLSALALYLIERDGVDAVLHVRAALPDRPLESVAQVSRTRADVLAGRSRATGRPRRSCTSTACSQTAPASPSSPSRATSPRCGRSSAATRGHSPDRRAAHVLLRRRAQPAHGRADRAQPRRRARRGDALPVPRRRLARAAAHACPRRPRVRRRLRHGLVRPERAVGVRHAVPLQDLPRRRRRGGRCVVPGRMGARGRQADPRRGRRPQHPDRPHRQRPRAARAGARRRLPRDRGVHRGGARRDRARPPSAQALRPRARGGCAAGRAPQPAHPRLPRPGGGAAGGPGAHALGRLGRVPAPRRGATREPLP